eukprot:2179836-Prymnesium_polylepis.1
MGPRHVTREQSRQVRGAAATRTAALSASAISAPPPRLEPQHAHPCFASTRTPRCNCGFLGAHVQQLIDRALQPPCRRSLLLRGFLVPAEVPVGPATLTISEATAEVAPIELPRVPPVELQVTIEPPPPADGDEPPPEEPKKGKKGK